MGKLITLTIIFISAVSAAFAQDAKLGSFNLGLDAAVPVKAESQIFNAAIGGSLQYQHKIIKNLYVSATGGLESFAIIKRLENATTPSNYYYIPLKAGLRYYAIWGLFGEVQGGESIYAQHGGGSAFDFSPGIGYSFKKGFELGIRYEEWKQTPEKPIPLYGNQAGPFINTSTFGQVALRFSERF